MKLMETHYGTSDYKSLGEKSNLRPGTFFLEEVDSLYRRYYDVIQANPVANGAY